MGDAKRMGRGMGKITKGLKSGQLQSKTIDFIFTNLPGWRDDRDRPVADSENDLNASLCKFLQVQASDRFSMVQFFHQERQGTRHSVDFSASPTSSTEFGGRLYTIYDSLLLIEGKRLPAPAKSRKMEYVTGGTDSEGRPVFSGGIQRFKLGRHGADHKVAVILGYIQKQSPAYWHSRINDWVSELAGKGSPDGCKWTVADKLKSQQLDRRKSTARSQSLHKREPVHGGGKILIHHLWVQM